MKRQKSAFTVVELITVVAIISLLVGLLIPALSAVKNAARDAKQRAQFTSIELALTAFKDNYGDYPPSLGWDYVNGAPLDYCGAQKLAEALVGWDLLGFARKSQFYSDGSIDTPTGRLNLYNVNDAFLMSQRRDPYLEVETAKPFFLGQLFANTGSLAADTYVLCDVYARKKVIQANGREARAGRPILYYKANTSGTTTREIYDIADNDSVVAAAENEDRRGHPLGSGPYPAPFNNQGEFFYGGANPATGPIGLIQDPKVLKVSRPYRPDSFLLISAGPDGIYGSGDDIYNFGD